MGILLTKVLGMFGKSEKRISMIGLDAAGKTSILYKLKLNENVHTIPTIGFNMEEVHFKRLSLQIWDIGGQKELRRLWHYYFDGLDALIFVIDSTDIPRIACTTMECEDCVKEELHYLLQCEELRNVALLIYANKQDQSGAVSPKFIREKLELDRVCVGRSWYIQPCCALTGDGLLHGLEWLAKEIEHKRK
ncbi:Arf1g [Monocercomonoides exilis]|uniref:Arf1g n=1 Tax=Monocercomonoides exilis TaxID=2049356 RepID=UPI00355A9D5B|nr:Arf1g [Monocercomonoides exilis]|eukprot:MONOS_14416.1-p1 / transcript=MONOS_14416.1 / gene=MONOS_14416 / organism=Monocercomonoides_exilis_PA203 / gene_product=Arf1g / transcript_product=Arf1g / location=Mono_scaffold00998:553-1202(+) / protein_length=191 / sequence_SO=supercontig / SO=protein_coding / is_pseudo=false